MASLLKAEEEDVYLWVTINLAVGLYLHVHMLLNKIEQTTEFPQRQLDLND
jgi:hypothetical protein